MISLYISNTFTVLIDLSWISKPQKAAEILCLMKIKSAFHHVNQRWKYTSCAKRRSQFVVERQRQFLSHPSPSCGRQISRLWEFLRYEFIHMRGVANDIAWNNVYKIDMLNFHLQQQRFGESYNSAYHFTWFCHSPGYINTIQWKPKNDLL